MSHENVRQEIRQILNKAYKYECQVAYGWYVDDFNKPENLKKGLDVLVQQLSFTKKEVESELESLEIRLAQSESKTNVGISVPMNDHPIILRGEIELFKKLLENIS